MCKLLFAGAADSLRTLVVNIRILIALDRWCGKLLFAEQMQRTPVGRLALKPPQANPPDLPIKTVQVLENPPIEVGFSRRRLEGKPPYLGAV